MKKIEGKMESFARSEPRTEQPIKARNEYLKTIAETVLRRCHTLARFSEDRDGTRRTFLSPPMHDCHRQIEKWLQPLGASTRIDAAGNLRALYAAADNDGEPTTRKLLIGSHLDTVPNAGAYDGVLGVVMAVALLESLEGRHLPFAIEVVGFSEEEGVRFGIPFIGSRALAGSLPPLDNELENDLLNRRDANGISVRSAIEEFGLNADELPNACLGENENILGYLEFHIEQGPALEELELPLGIVESIVGQSRLEFIFTGKANHAGTTPMHHRYDALAGASEWIVAGERYARAQPGLVATVGTIHAKPGAVNVIAGEARVSLDVRHALDETRKNAVNELIQKSEQIAECRKLQVECEILLEQKAVAMDRSLVEAISRAAVKSGCEPHQMVSGAGHDAMIMAGRVPAAMIFLRTPGGISHHPSETVLLEDVEIAIQCGLQLLNDLAQSETFLKRSTRA